MTETLPKAVIATEIVPITPESTVYQKIDALGYQSEDILKINYRKSPNDGTSWRNREIKYDQNDRTFSKQKLMSTVWVLDENITYSYVLVFYSDDYFIIGSYHTEPSAFGKYKFENGLLVLYSFSYDPNIKFYEKIFNETGLMQESGDATPAPNEEKVYCVTEEGRKVLTENVKFRKAPSKDADTQISEIYEEMFWNEPYWKETDCLIKGTVIPVYASTEKQETIYGMTACWYYVSMPTLSGFNQYGWIFGGFFKDYDESKKDEYAETLRNEFRLSPEQMK